MSKTVYPATATVPLDKLAVTDGGVPEGACVNYETCGNVVPGNGQICAACLDKARHETTPSS